MREVHMDDEKMICALIGSNEIPQKISDEYFIRRKMYHSCGASGAIGAVMVVDMLRHLGYGGITECVIPVSSWRGHIGKDVIVSLDSGKHFAEVLDVTDGGFVRVRLDDGQGVIEVPAYEVALVEEALSV